MKQYKEKEAVQPIAPSEYDEYRREIATFSPIKGKSRHFQFLEKKGVIYYEDYLGHPHAYVSSPVDYAKWDKIRDGVEKREWAELQQTFAQFPEEEIAWREKVNTWLKEVRQVLTKIRTDKKVEHTV